ncbi:hypothetical protein [Streptomyces sp. NPDC093089]|uniref:hypothetical protein n=1 Tax=Streptomyces sp. NPDC093089 TaxID=3366024 RepID=UPI003828D60B
MHDRFRGLVREHADHEPAQTAATVDSQSVRAADRDDLFTGYDAGKKAPGASATSLWTASAFS